MAGEVGQLVEESFLERGALGGRRDRGGTRAPTLPPTIWSCSIRRCGVVRTGRAGEIPGDPTGPRLLARSNSAGATHAFAAGCVARGVEFSFGFPVDWRIQTVVDVIPEACWHPAYELTTTCVRGPGWLRRPAWSTRPAGRKGRG